MDGPPVELEVLDETRSARWRTADGGAGGRCRCAVHPDLGVATPAALDLPLADLAAAGQAAAQSGFFGRKKRLIAVRDSLAPVLTAEVAPKAVPALASALLAAQTAARGLAARAAAIPGPAGAGVLEPDHRSGPGRPGGRLAPARPARSSRAGTASPAPCGRCSSRARRPIRRPRSRCGRPGMRWARCSPPAGPPRTSSRRGRARDGLFARWQATRTERAAGVPGCPRCAAGSTWSPRWSRCAPPVSARPASRCCTGAVPADDAVRSFELGLAAASMTEREEATGLAGFDAAGARAGDLPLRGGVPGGPGPPDGSAARVGARRPVASTRLLAVARWAPCSASWTGSAAGSACAGCSPSTAT